MENHKNILFETASFLFKFVAYILTMKKILSAILLLCIAATAFAQKTYHNKAFGITIQIPQTWWEDNRNGIPADNEIPDSERTKMLADSRSVFLTLFYDRETVKEGGNYIPKMQFNVAGYYEKGIDALKKATIANAEKLKKFQPDFTYIESPKEITISGIKSMYYIAEYSMLINGKPAMIRTHTYIIPYKNYIFHLNFTDEKNGKDRSKEFKEAVKTIKIG
jgi:hypothetical protein